MYEKELGIGIFGGKFISMGFDYVDKMTGKTSAPVFNRISTWLNLGGGAILSVLPYFIRFNDKTATILQSAGFTLLTKVIDYLGEITSGSVTTGKASYSIPAKVVYATPEAPKQQVEAITPKFSLDP